MSNSGNETSFYKSLYLVKEIVLIITSFIYIDFFIQNSKLKLVSALFNTFLYVFNVFYTFFFLENYFFYMNLNFLNIMLEIMPRFSSLIVYLVTLNTNKKRHFLTYILTSVSNFLLTSAL